MMGKCWEPSACTFEKSAAQTRAKYSSLLDLTQSAQELNAEFNLLVLAFNRDVAAFTENLQSELQCTYQGDISRRESRNWINGSDGTFINDGMLSGTLVRPRKRCCREKDF